MEVSRTAIPERRVAIPKDVLPTVSGANSGAPKLKLSQVVIVPANPVPVPVVTPAVQEDPELLALRRDAQAARALGITIQQYRQSQSQPQSNSQQRVGAIPRTPSPPQTADERRIAQLARRFGKTIEEVERVRVQARRLGMKTRDLLDQMAQAEEMAPTRSRREVKQVVPFASVQHLYTKGRFHGWKDSYDRGYCGV